MSMPTWLSGRLRQATSPKAANEPPTSAKATDSQSIGASVSNSTGRSASSSPIAGQDPERGEQRTMRYADRDAAARLQVRRCPDHRLLLGAW